MPHALTPELYCTDINISLPFYTDVLGFQIEYQRPEDGFAMLERNGVRFMLDQIGIDRTWIPAPLEYPLGRGVNFQIKTDHVDDLYQTVQASGAIIFLPMEEKWYRADDVYLGSKQFIVQDPDGYLLRFAENLEARTSLPENSL